jgi:hypothetical protein
MSKLIKGNALVKVDVQITFSVTEEEARALDALAGYGDQSAIDAFYAGCGKHYMQPYEGGLRSFLSTIRSVVTPALNQADQLRSQLKELKPLKRD